MVILPLIQDTLSQAVTQLSKVQSGVKHPVMIEALLSSHGTWSMEHIGVFCNKSSTNSVAVPCTESFYQTHTKDSKICGG